MKPHSYMRHFILLVAWAALGSCFPLSQGEHKLDLRIAQDSQPVGSSTTNNSAITAQTIRYSREINTALAGFVLLLTLGTYWLLTIYTTKLSTEIVLPSNMLERTITRLLNARWPKKCIGRAPERIDYEHTSWPQMLFYKGSTYNIQSGGTQTHVFSPQGTLEIYERLKPARPKTNSTASFQIFSPVVKGLVHIAIWNSVSFWLVLVMVTNTLVYNGFMSKNVTNDSIIRLFLVGLYAVTNIGHEIYCTTLLYRNFENALSQACWTYICKSFIFLDAWDFRTLVMRFISRDPFTWEIESPGNWDVRGSAMVWTSFNLKLFGVVELSNTYRLPLQAGDQIGTMRGAGVFEPLSADDQRRVPYLIARDKTESKLDKFIKPIRELEIKAYEKAVDSTLEKTLVNIGVLLSISLASALAPWTSVQAFNATNAQLGSYALLLSISAGFVALISSITQLVNATVSSHFLLQLLEKTVQASHTLHESDQASGLFPLPKTPRLGFCTSHSNKHSFTWFNLLKSTSHLRKLPCLLFSLALILIPGLPWFEINDKWLHFTVNKVNLSCSTTTGWFVRSCCEGQNQASAQSLQANESMQAERK